MGRPIQQRGKGTLWKEAHLLSGRHSLVSPVHAKTCVLGKCSDRNSGNDGAYILMWHKYEQKNNNTLSLESKGYVSLIVTFPSQLDKALSIQLYHASLWEKCISPSPSTIVFIQFTKPRWWWWCMFLELGLFWIFPQACKSNSWNVGV